MIPKVAVMDPAAGASVLPASLPSAGVYVPAGAWMQLQYWADTALPVTNGIALRWQLIEPSGKQTWVENPVRNLTLGAETVVRFPMAEGILVSAEFGNWAGYTMRRGQFFGVLSLCFNGSGGVIQTLAQGYPDNNGSVHWPQIVHEKMTAGEFHRFAIVGTDPAAGAELSQTIGTHLSYKLLGVYIPLVTDATVATRRPSLVIDDGTNAIGRFPASDTQAASLTQNYFFGDVPAATVVDGVVRTPLPPDLVLFGGWRIQTTTTNLQAGDNYGAPIYYVERYISRTT